jgi:hypothetical protein
VVWSSIKMNYPEVKPIKVNYYKGITELQETNEYIRKLVKGNGGKVTSVASDNSYLDCEIDLQHPSFNSTRHTYKVFLRISIEAIFGEEIK